MKDPTVKRVLAEKPWVKSILIAIMTLTVLCALLWVNDMWGNPIRKQMAKSKCLDYFEVMYNEEFIIIEISYWPKLPGYVLTLSPKSNPLIQFSCNPNCESLCYADEYGGVLASRLLIEEIRQILEPGYGNLALQITASEDPNTQYNGETPDYFEKDPLTRLKKNHQVLSLFWMDPNLPVSEFNQIADNIADLIEVKLPFINPNLEITITLFSDTASQAARFEANHLLFQTNNIND